MTVKTKKKKVVASTSWVGDYGPHLYGARLHINEPYVFSLNLPLSFDVETDELDNFVGVALCQTKDDVYYYSTLREDVRVALQTYNLVGHGARFDMDMIQKWGVDVPTSKLVFDTKIASYVLNSTAPSHGLKDLAKHYLDWSWPTYKQMVYPDPEHPRTKVTLDKQDVDKVARYCGMDALATLVLSQRLYSRMTDTQRKFFNEIEMPTYHLLHRMEKIGAQIDTNYLNELDEQLSKELEDIENSLHSIQPGEYNLNSPKQLLEVFKQRGLDVTETSAAVLKTLLPEPFIENLLKHRKIKKLQSTYTQGLLKVPTLPRVHTRFNQVTRDDHGIVTGRLSSSNPNLQNIPRVDKSNPNSMGSKVRRIFTAKNNHVLLACDYSQVEYRLFAHFTQDKVLLDIFSNNRDIHEETGKLVGASRHIGKTLNFASIYGAQAEKIGNTAGIATEQAELMLDTYWKKMPRAAAWVTSTKLLSRKAGGVTTLFGRFIPIPKLVSKNPWERMAAERQAINYVIQGSASEIIKKAMLDLASNSITPTLQVHDELLFEVPETTDLQAFTKKVIDIMENCVKLNNVKLVVEAGHGRNWAEAK